MTDLEQWKKDVELFGSNAYLTWEYIYIPTGKIKQMEPDQYVYDSNYFEFKRKQSAELPFDLERAKAGDEVECKHDDGWFTCSDWLQFKHLYGANNLRMKYPPKEKI